MDEMELRYRALKLAIMAFGALADEDKGNLRKVFRDRNVTPARMFEEMSKEYRLLMTNNPGKS